MNCGQSCRMFHSSLKNYFRSRPTKIFLRYSPSHCLLDIARSGLQFKIIGHPCFRRGQMALRVNRGIDSVTTRSDGLIAQNILWRTNVNWNCRSDLTTLRLFIQQLLKSWFRSRSMKSRDPGVNLDSLILSFSGFLFLSVRTGFVTTSSVFRNHNSSSSGWFITK